MNRDNFAAANTIPEQFNILLAQIEALAEHSPQFKKTGYVQRLESLIRQLADLPQDQLKLIEETLYYPPPLLELSLAIEDLKEKLAPGSRQTDICIPGSADCTPEPCTGTTQAEADDANIAAAAAEIAAAIAHGVAAAIPQEIAGESNPAYIAALVVATGLDVVAKGLALDAAVLQKAANERAACEEAAFQEVVYSMCRTINRIKASLDNLHTKVDLIDRKINILLKLLDDLQKLTEKIFFLEIEENLTECQTLTSLYLPEAVDGNLETIQQLIQTLINSSINAGLSTGNAESYLKQGMSASLSKDYTKALHWYSLAYKQLAAYAGCQLPKCPEGCSPPSWHHK